MGEARRCRACCCWRGVSPAWRRCRMRVGFIGGVPTQEIPHDNMRKAIAKRLTSAKKLLPDSLHHDLTVD